MIDQPLRKFLQALSDSLEEMRKEVVSNRGDIEYLLAKAEEDTRMWLQLDFLDDDLCPRCRNLKSDMSKNDQKTISATSGKRSKKKT